MWAVQEGFSSNEGSRTCLLFYAHSCGMGEERDMEAINKLSSFVGR